MFLTSSWSLNLVGAKEVGIYHWFCLSHSSGALSFVCCCFFFRFNHICFNRILSRNNWERLRVCGKCAVCPYRNCSICCIPLPLASYLDRTVKSSFFLSQFWILPCYPSFSIKKIIIIKTQKKNTLFPPPPNPVNGGRYLSTQFLFIQIYLFVYFPLLMAPTNSNMKNSSKRLEPEDGRNLPSPPPHPY